MKTSTQLERGRSIWTSRRFDERVEFDARELRRQPDFGPSRELKQVRREPQSDSYARRFYGDRAAPSAQARSADARSADEGLSDVVAAPRRSASARKVARPLWRRA